MIDFDKYKELYQCDFSKSITDISAISYSQAQLRTKEQEHQLQKLFQFIELWKDRYELFCDTFDTYSCTTGKGFHLGQQTEGSVARGLITLPKSEFYIDEFFNTILNRRAKFEVQQYHQNYNPEYDGRRVYEYSKQPDQNIIISGNKFTIIGKDNNYRLDIKMNAALICSLIGAISNNIVIHQWYNKQSKFKEFIDNMAKSHYYVEFGGINSIQPHILVSGSQNEPTLRIDFDGRWLYFILPNEILRVENRLHYKHLDDLFGKDRKEPLTKEDLQLYSIVNEGRKPIMYDFEF